MCTLTLTHRYGKEIIALKNMDNPLFKIDNSLLNKFKRLQGTENYVSSSTIRFWLNDEPTAFTTHWHPDIEIVIPLENIYTVIIDRTKYLLSPGDIFLILSGEPHQLIAPEKGLRLIYLLDFSILSKIRGFSYISTYLCQPVLINQSTCDPIYKQESALIADLFRDYCSEESLREFPLYSKLIMFFFIYGNYRLSQENNFAPFSTNSEKQKYLLDKFNTVFNYLDEHYAEDITLEQLAAIAGFSKFHFSRLFKQYSGQNFYEYLCFRRIKAAEALLLRPDISITEIALQSGFSSLSTFNRMFKKLKKCTPSKYRKLYISQLSPFSPDSSYRLETEKIPYQSDFPEGK